MILMYKMYVLPYVDYGDILYDGANVRRLDKIQRLQNRAFRLILRVEDKIPVILLHQRTKLSNLKVRREAHFMFKQQNNLEIVNVLNVRTRAHDAMVFTTLLPKNEKYRKSVLYRGAITWNSLPMWMKSIGGYQAFKLQQKKWM